MIRLRKVKTSDRRYFAKWWRDKALLKVTSGELRRITDQEVDKYFLRILNDQKGLQYIISVDGKTIGHLALEPRKGGWYETQIVIGEKSQQGKEYGTKSIKQLIGKAKRVGVTKIYLEVRPDNTKAINAYKQSGFKAVSIKKYPKNKNLPQTIKMVLNA
ncbi:MAG: GNAT family N-acetyltransferase [Patescibacteria group bacterium]|jgi:RimJ/RimL family protein N-acetyltransferase